MPKLRDIKYQEHAFVKLAGIPWFSEATNQSGLAQGGIYLLSGQPGGGKTTLSLQIACDLAAHAHKVLYLSLEQSPGDLKQKIENQIFVDRRAQQPTPNGPSLSWEKGLKKARKIGQQIGHSNAQEERVFQNLYIDSSVSGMEMLPDFLARQVLGATGAYSGVNLIVIDSIQGLGTAPTSSKPYQRLFEFNRWAKEHGITVILIGHVTKGGAIAGPRSLEHNVDCVLYLRKAMRLRPLFVPKNRFGAERHEPLTLIMNSNGCIEKSKHVKARASQAYGFLPGGQGDLIEVQALVKLPKYGDRAGIKAPYLPRQKLSQLVGIVSGMHEIDISDLTFEINCALPGGRPYRETLDLPLAMSMLSSYFQRQIPTGTLFVGEVDLFQAIRPLASGVCRTLGQVLLPGELCPLAERVHRVFLSAGDEDELSGILRDEGLKIQVHGVSTLDALVESMWPDVVETP